MWIDVDEIQIKFFSLEVKKIVFRFIYSKITHKDYNLLVCVAIMIVWILRMSGSNYKPH